MNRFDKELIALDGLQGLQSLDGWLSKTFKKAKKVVKKAATFTKLTLTSPVKATKATIDDPDHILDHVVDSAKEQVSALNHVRIAERRLVVPKDLREISNKVGSTLGNNKVFQVIVSTIATAFGLGLAAEAAWIALALYNDKMARKEQPTAADKQALIDSVMFMLKIPPVEREKILVSLSPEVQKEVRAILNVEIRKDLLAKGNAKIPAKNDTATGLGDQKPVFIAAFDAGKEISNDPEIQATIKKLLSEGKTIAQITELMKGSQFAKEIQVPLIKEIILPTVDRIVSGGDLPKETADKIATNIAIKETNKPSMIPVALIAATLLLG